MRARGALDAAANALRVTIAVARRITAARAAGTTRARIGRARPQGGESGGDGGSSGAPVAGWMAVYVRESGVGSRESRVGSLKPWDVRRKSLISHPTSHGQSADGAASAHQPQDEE